jgi:hypothetical protein
VARISAFDEYALDLRRAAVTLAVVAAHIALIGVMLRSAGHSEDVMDITLFALPINPEDRRREPVHVQKRPVSRASETAPRRAAVAREPATEQRVDPSLLESARSEDDTPGDTVATQAGAASEPVPPIDWHAEIETSAHALEQHDTIESGRRSLAGPRQPALSAGLQKPACPYEKCEPGWGENLGVFKPSLHSKAGRIEKIPSDMPITSGGNLNITGDETILWINNRCYTIIVSLDPQRRGMYRCVTPLGKTAARGDLFDHMNESQPPQSHDTDDPWISYGLSIGVSRDRHPAP